MNWPWGGPQRFPPYQPPFHPMQPFPQAHPQQQHPHPHPQQHPQQLSQHPQYQLQAQPQPIRPPPPPPHFFNSLPGFPPPFHAPPQHPPLTHQQPHISHFPQTIPYETKPPHRQHPQPSPIHSQKSNDATPKRQKPANPPERHSRDLVTAHETARRLGKNLPGDNEDEIRRWIEARKKNWPSRANVARKLEAAHLKEARETGMSNGKKAGGGGTAVGALAKLAEYGSSEDEGEVKEGKDKRETQGKREKGGEEGKRGRRGRRKRSRGKRHGRGVEKRNKEHMSARRTRPLLKMLLKEEIQRESAVLLQAFRFLVKHRRSELEKGEKDDSNAR